jgi:plastocyanin
MHHAYFAIAIANLVGGTSLPAQGAQSPTAVAIRLTEWKLEVSMNQVPAGPTVFAITNGGSIPHALEVEGRGLERRTRLLQPGQTDTLTLTLRTGSYEIYCPVGDDSHKHLGMLASLVVGSSEAAPTPAAGPGAHAAQTLTSHGIEVVGGGAVVQILPGPFPFADSAVAVIAARPADQQTDLRHKAEQGPYSNNVAVITGTARFAAWDKGAERDSVNGTATFTTQDGARWRLMIDRVQTRDIPFNPRFGGVIMGLYYHGASGVHTPLVPTIRSAVALWAFGHLYRNDALVSDTVMVHIMLLSRTRRPSDFALACWDCSTKPIEELQLQVMPAPDQPPFDAPGGFLFVNWERSTARPR